MDAEMVQSGDTCVLRLKGKWTLERAHKLKNLLIGALKGGDRVLVELEGGMEADLSCLQLLHSAHRSSSKLGKRLSIHGDEAESFEQMVRNAGFAAVAGCFQGADGDRRRKGVSGA